MANELTQVVFTDKAPLPRLLSLLAGLPREGHRDAREPGRGSCPGGASPANVHPRVPAARQELPRRSGKSDPAGPRGPSGGGIGCAVVCSPVGQRRRSRLPSVLRKLGFAYVAETPSAAYQVARATAQHVTAHPDASHVCSACPVVVNYIERYQSDLSNLIVPVVSPMLAHAMHIKKRLGPNCPDHLHRTVRGQGKQRRNDRRTRAGSIACSPSTSCGSGWNARTSSSTVARRAHSTKHRPATPASSRCPRAGPHRGDEDRLARRRLPGRRRLRASAGRPRSSAPRSNPHCGRAAVLLAGLPGRRGHASRAQHLPVAPSAAAFRGRQSRRRTRRRVARSPRSI